MKNEWIERRDVNYFRKMVFEPLNFPKVEHTVENGRNIYYIDCSQFSPKECEAIIDYFKKNLK